MSTNDTWSGRLVGWFSENAKEYPWRTDPTPYHVWLSEIMLQQTRLETVRPYYTRFITQLPTIAALADAPEEEVLKLWEGLGYYSRARNLHKAAKVIASDYGGEMPASYEAVRALPGIGDYTAGAICAQAFGLPTPAVDGNVLRVVSRLFELTDDVLSPVARKKVTELVSASYPADAPSAFTQGLMELGETLCLPGEPACEACPLSDLCLAHAHGRERELPVRIVKTAKKEEQRVLLLVEKDGLVLFHKRPKKGVLAGLWELPEESTLAEALNVPAASLRGEKTAEYRHVFTHLIWNIEVYRGTLSDDIRLDESFLWADPAELMLPTAFAKAFTSKNNP